MTIENTSDEPFGVVVAPDTVRFERLLPGPIERVWAYLTDSDKRGKWLASGAMEPRVGGQATLFFRHKDLTPHAEPTPEKYKAMEDGITSTERVTRWEPPHALAITWGQSEVTFELTPRGEQVLLVLTHRRLPNRDEAVGTSGGWHIHLAILSDVLHGRTPRPFWSTHAGLEAEYERRIPA